MQLKGIVPPTFTIFHNDESLDLKRTRAHLQFLIERGVHGIFVLGTNGEMPLLTLEEKLEVIEATVDEVRGRVPILVGVGCPGTRETVILAEYAQRVGATAIVVITPYFFPLTVKGIIGHYKSVAESVDLPILIYHNPQFTGYRLSLETLLQLSEIPNIQGIKDSSGDVSWLFKLRRAFPHWVILHGIDAIIYPSLMLGLDGSVSGVANVFPEVVVALYNAIVQKDHEKAKCLQAKIAYLEEITYRGPFLAGIKAALAWRGFPAGWPRSPLVKLSEDEQRQLWQELDGLGLDSLGLQRI